MRLTITQPTTETHSDACTSVHTSLGGDMLTGGDDCSVWRWNANGEPIAKVIDLESCITIVRWLPGSGRKKGAEAAKDAFVVACASGTFCFVTAASARIERSVEAHTGAITGLVWSAEEGTMVTAGEDGCVKVWSQAGVQRSVLASTGKCIYALAWGPNTVDLAGESVIFASGSEITVKPLSAAVKKQLVWKAHRGTCLCLDYTRMSNVIVSGGEDGIYRVWDIYGRNLFASMPGLHPVTACAFSPDGDMFAVGSFMSVVICDRIGWMHCRQETKTGSVQALCWTPDSTQVVLGGSSGKLAVAQLVDRYTYWKHLTCVLSDTRKLRIHDVVSDSVEELEHRDKVIKVSLGFGFLVVATTTQCVIYDVTRFNAPVSFDLRDAVVSMQQAERTFFISDCSQGVLVYSYEGRAVCTIKPAATLRPELLATTIISLSPETFACRDPADPKKISFYDAISGKILKDVFLTHHMDIHSCALSHYGSMQERKLVFIDRNRDLYIASVHSKQPSVKLAAMVSSARWNDGSETLVAVADGRIVTWYYPSIVFIDRDLLPRTKYIRDDAEELDRNDQIADFNGSRVSVRRGRDGALLTFTVSPYPNLLYSHVGRNDWEGAVRLCRYLKEDGLWSVLAALAVKNAELGTAEVAYAALEEVDKLRFISEAKDIPTPEGRQAELALFMRRPEEAERILIQAGLILRAIEMHTTLYNWERALEIAVERRTHVDTVLAYRQKHLEQVGRKETIDKFRQIAATVKVEIDKVTEKVNLERTKERERGAASLKKPAVAGAR